jgi:hypothetical protein
MQWNNLANSSDLERAEALIIFQPFCFAPLGMCRGNQPGNLSEALSNLPLGCRAFQENILWFGLAVESLFRLARENMASPGLRLGHCGFADRHASLFCQGPEGEREASLHGCLPACLRPGFIIEHRRSFASPCQLHFLAPPLGRGLWSAI